MGKKGSWFDAVKKALNPDSNVKKDQKDYTPKKEWFGKLNNKDVSFSGESTAPTATPSSRTPPPPPLPQSRPPLPPPLPPPPPPPRLVENVQLTEIEDEQSKNAYSVAFATTVAAEEAVPEAQTAAEVVHLSSLTRYPGKSKEERAAIQIQTAFRGYLARRTLRGLKGLMRLRLLLKGQSVTKQSTTTLRCMQTLASVQSQVRARRIRMSKENQALQRQMQTKQEKELGKLIMGGRWDDSSKSKEQIEKKLQNRRVASTRRERALAYAFSHQQTWKNSSKSMNTMNPKNPLWGWNWLERWMEARPWDSQSTLDFNDHAFTKNAVSHIISAGEIAKSLSQHNLNNNDHKSSPTGKKSTRPVNRDHSPSSPISKIPSLSSVARKTVKGNDRSSCVDEDSKNTTKVKSVHYRRHSIAGSLVRDVESVVSSPTSPSYKRLAKSAKATNSELPSSLGIEKNGTLENGSVGSAKKRLSFPRRHSEPPNIDISSIIHTKIHKKEKVGGNK